MDQRAKSGLVTAVIAAISASCDDAPPVAVDGVVSLVPVAESRAPHTVMGEIALADEDTACVIDSYRYKVYCADRGKKLWTFGHKGEGPGEFLGPTSIFRDSTGSIAVLDAGKSSVSIFEVTGAFLSESAIPLVFLPMGHLTSTLAAVVHDPGAGFRQVEVDIASGKTAWDRFFSADLVDCRSGGIPGSLGAGIPTPGDGIAFTTRGGRFVPNTNLCGAVSRPGAGCHLYRRRETQRMDGRAFRGGNRLVRHRRARLRLIGHASGSRDERDEGKHPVNSFSVSGEHGSLL